MTPRQLADVGVARLGLPVPMAKLLTIQAIARALNNEATAEAYGDALVEWINTRELESQCLEALCPLLVTEPKPVLISRVRQAIKQPSIASDLLLSLAADTPILFPSWSGRHSGPLPRFLSLTKEEESLRACTFIPPLFINALEELQEMSGQHFIRRWAFEYLMLLDRIETKDDGHLGYFLEPNRSNIGQFVAVKGHVARSAYLRTLAYAVEIWKMPDNVAYKYAAEAVPSEPIFLRLAPQSPPVWASNVHTRSAMEASDAATLARTVVQHIERAQQAKVFHCSLAVVDEPTYHAELDVFAVVKINRCVNPKEVIDFYQYLVGKASPDRVGLRAFVSADMGTEDNQLLGFSPVLLPLIGTRVGYLQTELLGRVPYMPISTQSFPELELVPRFDTAALLSESRDVGNWHWWLWNWNPSHPEGWPSPTACLASLKPEVARQMADDLGGDIEQVWKLTTWQRERDYGDWNTSERCGSLNC